MIAMLPPIELNKGYAVAEFLRTSAFLSKGALIKESDRGKEAYVVFSRCVAKMHTDRAHRAIQLFGRRLFDESDNGEWFGETFEDKLVRSICEWNTLNISVVSVAFFDDVRKWFEPVDAALQSVLPPPLVAIIKGYVPYGFVDYDSGPTPDSDHSKKQRVS